MITGPQIRAARAFLNWKQSRLADQTGLPPQAISASERGIVPPATDLHLLQRALERAGIVFIDDVGVGIAGAAGR
ncbi:helix-turn-helix domain-containing protein [Lichenicoccus sp.]|uniref:helix-turn-helix domain-containing protein n=1 Tax=Lichenicoccus sp. TaxID=2781899 RepID=UPI003D10A7C9